MSDFKLEILTPERMFFSDMVEYISVESSDGRLTVMKNHAPMVAAVRVGRIDIKRGDETVTAFSTDGFLEVLPTGAVMFAQKCEWRDEIDINRAISDEELASERLLKQQSLREYRESKIMLTRALARLRIANVDFREEK